MLYVWLVDYMLADVMLLCLCVCFCWFAVVMLYACMYVRCYLLIVLNFISYVCVYVMYSNRK